MYSFSILVYSFYTLEAEKQRLYCFIFKNPSVYCKFSDIRSCKPVLELKAEVSFEKKIGLTFNFVVILNLVTH